MSNEKENLKTKIIEALQTVYDPEIPVSVYELGLMTRGHHKVIARL